MKMTILNKGLKPLSKLSWIKASRLTSPPGHLSIMGSSAAATGANRGSLPSQGRGEQLNLWPYLKVSVLILLLAVMLAPLAVANVTVAQLGGEDLPEGVTGDDVYRVSSKMYCDVCAGVPVSACASPTCAAWRQEVANLLGQGYTDEEIMQEFAVLYGDEISGVPLGGSDRTIALLLPALLALGVAVVIVWQVLAVRQRGSSRAQAAADAAGLHEDFERPVPDNVDPEYLERFLILLEEHQTR